MVIRTGFGRLGGVWIKPVSSFSVHRHFLLLLALGAVLGLPGRAQTTQPTDDKTLELPKFEVNEFQGDEMFDQTGMGAVDEELRSAPFSNDLITVDLDQEEGLGADLSVELSAISTSSPADNLAGEERLNLRGFPRPVLRNGFIQQGIPETLNINKTIMIQGPLVPVLGRAAPGGIQDFITTRPSARDRNKLESSLSSDERLRFGWETTGVLKKNRLWQRWALDWQRKLGPEEFVRSEDLNLNGALTVKHSRAASSLVSLDYRRMQAFVTPGIPEYKNTAAEKIIGPYRPLASFNGNGPDAGIFRESVVLGAQFESQVSRQLALRLGAEAWARTIDQDRFTATQYVLDTGLFRGIREPRHGEQRQQAVAAHAELTARFRTGKIEHKLLTHAGVTWGEYGREDRALTIADRNALPLSVRQFDPFAPDYYSPVYSPELFSRVITDRVEHARYTTAEISDRVAIARGRTVLTGGLRYDAVDLAVDDRKAGAAMPNTPGRAGHLSYHAGINHQWIPSRVLLFATVSTAFDPSTRVDARTGRIQDNETTLGYEAGVKGRARAGQLDYSSSAYLLYNQHISRRNPLYDDPVFDAAQTQPQLVAAGEERITGLRAELRYKLGPTLSLSLRGIHMVALTTKSPSLGSEVGRQITRLPKDTGTVQLRYAPAKSLPGFNCGASVSYLSSYVANYEDSQHAYLDYPGYAVVSLNAGYSWKIGSRQVSLGASVRNALDRDLLASNDRVGAGREWGLSTRVMF